MFFYLKYENKELKYEEVKPINKLFDMNRKLKIQIFIKIKKMEENKMNLNYFLNLKTIKKDTVYISSKALKNFKDNV